MEHWRSPAGDANRDTVCDSEAEEDRSASGEPDTVSAAGSVRSIEPYLASKTKRKSKSGPRGGVRLLPRHKNRRQDAPLVHPIIGSSDLIKQVRETVALFAPENEPVLICGETGVGKEAIATEIHRLSPRCKEPLVVRNVGRIDRDLAGSEFFGHEKGAFTGAVDKRVGVFERADKGSLHLDEIAELPLELQANLLRVVEDGLVVPVGGNAGKPVDVRLIAASNVDLASAVAKHQFREDLYYRLNVLKIEVPPLRARGDDVIEIADYWLNRRAEDKETVYKLSAKAADKLKTYGWPGNIRELKNALTRAAILCGGGKIDADHIVLDPPRRSRGGGLNINDGKDLVARYLAAKALADADGNVSKAAKLTKLNRTSFHELKKELTDENCDLETLASDLRKFLDIC